MIYKLTEAQVRFIGAAIIFMRRNTDDEEWTEEDGKNLEQVMGKFFEMPTEL